MPQSSRVLEHILAQPWLIQADALETMLAIAQRYNDSPEAVAAKLGRPLDNTRAVEMRGDVAVIPVHGPIFRYANLFTELSGATSLEILATDFNAALSDRAVKRIVLDIDSPGGQATGISEFAEMIASSNKPVAAYVGGLAASASYWFASAASPVVVADTSMLGSIGVVGTYKTTKNDKEIKIISSQSPLKQASPETEAGRVEVQRVVDDLADVFISAISKYRAVDRDTVLSDFGRGGVLVGAKAVAAGMADRLGSLESIIAGDSGQTKEVFSMTENTPAPEITREYLAANHPAIVQAIEDDAMNVGLQEGAESERTRIQAVLDVAIPGHEALVKGLAFDGKTTAPEAALAVLSAEKQSRADYQHAMLKSVPPVPSASASDDAGGAETFEAKVEAHQSAGLSRGKAMAAAVRENPSLHKAWLARINPKAAQGA